MGKIFLAGGAGYIGSHTALSLLRSGYEIVTADNYSNSSPEALNRVMELSGKTFKTYEADMTDTSAIAEIFSENEIDAVIHFAGLKAVGESVEKPLEYYRCNLDATLSLLEMMRKYSVKNIIFSSSATVYGGENPSPYREDMSRSACTNPYGWTKFMSEQIIEDTVKAEKNISAILLRYFNPVGADESGMIGEDPLGIPNNLMPCICQTAVGRREKLTIFGRDYDTPDGTCRRDYIHVSDLADGHVKALDYMLGKNSDGKIFEIFNLGTGVPYSVTEIVQTFERVNNIKLNYSYGERRAGDLPECFAEPSRANEVLSWTAKKSLEDMCRDSWNWQSKNPQGYNK